MKSWATRADPKYIFGRALELEKYPLVTYKQDRVHKHRTFFAKEVVGTCCVDPLLIM